MDQARLSVSAIPAFSDNYIWLLVTGTDQCVVVDPGDAKAVIQRLERDRLELNTVLVTHHHPDHFGAAGPLKEVTGAAVYVHPAEYERSHMFVGPRADPEMVRRYFLAIGRWDPKYDRQATEEFLNRLSPQEVSEVAS